MILVDTGPLVTLIDSGQGEAHTQCVRVCDQLRDSMLTTWPCLTEAMYFLSELRGLRNIGLIAIADLVANLIALLSVKLLNCNVFNLPVVESGLQSHLHQWYLLE